MGTWNAGSFGNDSALDFAGRVLGTPDLARAFERVADAGGRIDSDQASEAIAAADILAALLGRASDDLPEEIARTLPSFDAASSALIARAIETVHRVRDHSELAELWAEAEGADWIDATNDLLARLDMNTAYLAAHKDHLAADDIPTGKIGAVCHFCGRGIPSAEEVTLVVESHPDDVWFRSVSYSHAECIKQNLVPPHFNADGTAHQNILVQLRKQLGGL